MSPGNILPTSEAVFKKITLWALWATHLYPKCVFVLLCVGGRWEITLCVLAALLFLAASRRRLHLLPLYMYRPALGRGAKQRNIRGRAYLPLFYVYSPYSFLQARSEASWHYLSVGKREVKKVEGKCRLWRTESSDVKTSPMTKSISSPPTGSICTVLVYVISMGWSLTFIPFSSSFQHEHTVNTDARIRRGKRRGWKFSTVAAIEKAFGQWHRILWIASNWFHGFSII
jgi:hypothetical protein